MSYGDFDEPDSEETDPLYTEPNDGVGNNDDEKPMCIDRETHRIISILAAAVDVDNADDIVKSLTATESSVPDKLRKLIKKAQAIARMLAGSLSLWQKLENMCKAMNVDFKMLIHAVKLVGILLKPREYAKYCFHFSRDPDMAFKESDWELFLAVKQFLEPFYTASKRLLSLMEPRQFAAQVPLQLILKDLQALEADQTSADLQLHEALLQITTTRENNCLQKRKIKRIVDLVSHILDTENDSFVVLHEAWLAASRQPIVEESRDDLKQQRDERSSSLCRTLESLSALSKGADRAATFISTASANRVPSNAEEPSANLLLTGTAAALCTLPINDNDLPKFEAIVPAKLTIHSEFNASSTIAALAPPTLLSNVHMTACPTPSTATFLSVERDEFPKTNVMPVQKNVLPQPPKVVESSLTELDAVTSTMPLILSVPLTKASLPVSSAAEPIISVVRAEFIQKDDKIVQLCGEQNALVFGQIGEEGVDVGFPKKHMEAKHFKIYQKVSEPWKGVMINCLTEKGISVLKSPYSGQTRHLHKGDKRLLVDGDVITAGGSTFRYRNVPCVDVLVAKFFISKNSLGDGATGKVVAIKDRMTGMLWAAKIPESRNLSVLQAFRREAEILAKLKNRSGIVQLQEVLEGDGQIYIILEYLPRGSLEDFINASGPASEAVVKTWVLKMVEILQLLDDMGIIHQDWKPSNLVFDSTMNLKLIDFGCGKEAVSSTLREGTVSFMAPEVLERKEHDQRAELYSLGLIIVYSLCGESLWGCEATEKEISSRMKLGALTLQKIDHISKDGCHLIETLLAYDRDGRPRLEEIRNHKWFSIDNRYEKTTSKFSYILDTASRTNFILVRDLMKSADLRKAVQGFSIEGMVYEGIDQSFKDAFNQMKISEPEVTSTKRAIPLHAANLTIIEAWCNSNAHSLNLVKDARKRLLVMEVKEIVF
ncbi:hypothetical protein HDU79_002650 [Rhizoclosmatium sp. JEL0117]|nr:hypothetical protein HDU79_002650 [Rhizoclosmatium sp. JEL0117]